MNTRSVSSYVSISRRRQAYSCCRSCDCYFLVVCADDIERCAGHAEGSAGHRERKQYCCKHYLAVFGDFYRRRGRVGRSAGPREINQHRSRSQHLRLAADRYLARWNCHVADDRRVIQGISAACVMPATLALVKAYFDGKARQRAISFWSIGSWGGDRHPEDPTPSYGRGNEAAEEGT
jgi:hypothetical protein